MPTTPSKLGLGLRLRVVGIRNVDLPGGAKTASAFEHKSLSTLEKDFSPIQHCQQQAQVLRRKPKRISLTNTHEVSEAH